MTYYDILGVPMDASDADIKKAYRAQVRFFHPDVFDGPEEVARIKTLQLNEAYETLKDPARRKHYDWTLRFSTKTESEPEKDQEPPTPPEEEPKEEQTTSNSPKSDEEPPCQEANNSFERPRTTTPIKNSGTVLKILVIIIVFIIIVIFVKVLSQKMYDNGMNAGYASGYTAGHAAASREMEQTIDALMVEQEAALEASYTDGYNTGVENGVDTGYNVGHEIGFNSGISQYQQEIAFFRNYACLVLPGQKEYHHYKCQHIRWERNLLVYDIAITEGAGLTPCKDCWNDGLKPDNGGWIVPIRTIG